MRAGAQDSERPYRGRRGRCRGQLGGRVGGRGRIDYKAIVSDYGLFRGSYGVRDTDTEKKSVAKCHRSQSCLTTEFSTSQIWLSTSRTPRQTVKTPVSGGRGGGSGRPTYKN